MSTNFTSIITSFITSIAKSSTLRTFSYLPLIPAIILGLLKDQSRHDWLGGQLSYDSSYDYIVIGAGSAGAVMAARLSEDKYKSVLLLECGGTENILSDIPVLDLNMQMTPLDWAYSTVPQKKSCFGLKGRVSRWPRGRVMGGSSTLNTMIYSRANSRDYDNWAANGSKDWTFADIFPYFIKSEDNTDPSLVATGYHGTGGPLTVSSPTDPHLISKIFVDSGPYLGYPVGDINGPKQSVFMLNQRTVRNGKRCSTSKAYLESLVDRNNLQILTNSCVTRIIFDGNNRAKGIVFDGKLISNNVVFARNEIILSAGAIGSPQLLMLSGIGPKEHLNSLGIEVISDLRVGDNLMEHFGSSLSFTTSAAIGLTLRDEMRAPDVLEYLYSGNTSLSNPVTEATAFIKTKYTNQSDDWPDIQFYLNAGSVITDSGFRIRKLIGITDEVFSKVFEPYVGRNTFTITAIVLRPESRGYIRLKSTNPYDYPIIEPNFFGAKQDINVLIEGLKTALSLISAPGFREYNVQPFQTKFAGCGHLELYSDDYLSCMARVYTIVSYHPSGTCRMGAIEDSYTVVDPQLKVKGVKGLRVVDGSVMPFITSGNLNGPIVAMAEKIADNMKGIKTTPFKPPLNTH